jgi:hypothetical protein
VAFSGITSFLAVEVSGFSKTMLPDVMINPVKNGEITFTEYRRKARASCTYLLLFFSVHHLLNIFIRYICWKELSICVFLTTSQKINSLTRCQVLRVASMKITAFWDVAPCSCRSFRFRFRRFSAGSASVIEAIGDLGSKNPETSVNLHQIKRLNIPDGSHLQRL